MILAELLVRHTRRHMPTRRVALGEAYLPTSGPAYGAVLLGAVVAEHLPDLDDEQADAAPAARVRRARRTLGPAHRAALPTADRHAWSRPVAPSHRERHRSARARARSPRAARSASDRGGDGRGRAAARGADRSRSAPSTRRSSGPGVLPEGLEVRRLLLGHPGRRTAAAGHGIRRRRRRRGVVGRPGGPAVGDGGTRLAC